LPAGVPAPMRVISSFCSALIMAFLCDHICDFPPPKEFT
jgi:hypothetical protein